MNYQETKVWKKEDDGKIEVGAGSVQSHAVKCSALGSGRSCPAAILAGLCRFFSLCMQQSGLHLPSLLISLILPFLHSLSFMVQLKCLILKVFADLLDLVFPMFYAILVYFIFL